MIVFKDSEEEDLSRRNAKELRGDQQNRYVHLKNCQSCQQSCQRRNVEKGRRTHPNLAVKKLYYLFHPSHPLPTHAIWVSCAYHPKTPPTITPAPTTPTKPRESSAPRPAPLAVAVPPELEPELELASSSPPDACVCCSCCSSSSSSSSPPPPPPLPPLGSGTGRALRACRAATSGAATRSDEGLGVAKAESERMERTARIFDSCMVKQCRICARFEGCFVLCLSFYEQREVRSMWQGVMAFFSNLMQKKKDSEVYE